MESSRSSDQLPLVIIVGPTASGKTALAIELAQKYRGEVVCTDSRTIYKYMDIGTAKPTLKEQAKVRHWGLDLIEPGERFTAADFKEYALKKIQEIRTRNHVPILVGGTGLYIDSILFDYQFNEEYDIKLRQKLEKLTLAQLYKYCNENSIKLPENHKNKRYIIRAIERKNVSTTRKFVPIKNTIVVGIAIERQQLRARIVKRTEQIFSNGVVEEATLLGKKYGWQGEAMTGNIYRIVRLYLLGGLTLEEAKEKNTTADWRLAKRQLTWFKRNPYIKWGSLTETKEYLESLLANR